MSPIEAVELLDARGTKISVVVVLRFELNDALLVLSALANS